MRNAEKLKNSMQPGRVYRRQDLEGYSTAVDRDLHTLVASGEVCKLAGGALLLSRQECIRGYAAGRAGTCEGFS